jgi:hypothetical protein
MMSIIVSPFTGQGRSRWSLFNSKIVIFKNIFKLILKKNKRYVSKRIKIKILLKK